MYKTSRQTFQDSLRAMRMQKNLSLFAETLEERAFYSFSHGGSAAIYMNYKLQHLDTDNSIKKLPTLLLVALQFEPYNKLSIYERSDAKFYIAGLFLSPRLSLLTLINRALLFHLSPEV